MKYAINYITVIFGIIHFEKHICDYTDNSVLQSWMVLNDEML